MYDNIYNWTQVRVPFTVDVGSPVHEFLNVQIGLPEGEDDPFTEPERYYDCVEKPDLVSTS